MFKILQNSRLEILSIFTLRSKFSLSIRTKHEFIRELSDIRRTKAGTLKN